MVDDALFHTLERWQGPGTWGRVLDAGTGFKSLQWLLSLQTEQVVAVTGAPARSRNLAQLLGDRLRSQDQLLVGNWSDPAFLYQEQFDVVLADYLLGAIAGFAPYFQTQLFRRLRPHVGGRLLAIGMSPFDDTTSTAESALVLEIAHLRDACILLAGHRTYREYPLDWVIRSLEESGFEIDEATEVPIVFRARWINGQLDVCTRKLPYFGDPGLAARMRTHIEALRLRALGWALANDGLRFGSDWLVSARPC